MDEEIMDMYTSFPQLDYAEGSSLRSTSVTWNSGTSGLSLDDVAFSWAAILQSLTGDDTPVFSLNGDAVKTDWLKRSFERVKIAEISQKGLGYTGSATPPKDCSLAVSCSLEQGNGYITSTGGVANTYLVQLARQLKSNIIGSSQLPSNNIELSVVNPEPHAIQGPSLLHDMVSKRCGENLALEFLDKNRTRYTLSYDELHVRSSHLASRIRNSLEYSPHTTPIIPVLIPQSPELYITWLGILKAGAAVCPLHIDAPPDRVNFIVNDVGANCVVTLKSLIGTFFGVDRPLVVIVIDDETSDYGGTGAEGDIYIPPEGLAYVMYTSGSTGVPKGVALSHYAATQALLAHEEHIPHFKRFLQFAAPTFDVSVFEIFFPFFRGATLVACERSLMLNDLIGVMTELEIDAAELTPTVAGELLRKRKAVPSLRLLLTIGEMLTRRVVDEFGFSSSNNGALYAMYGPTEATIHCTIAPKLTAGSRVGNIGRPLQSVSALIMPIQPSVSGEPEVLPVGCIGELVVGGLQLATEYLNRPEENQRAFIMSQIYGRLYRTGDKARLHPNGQIECLGRVTSGQVKLRGQRMELGEVESAIFKTPGIVSAAACVVDGILVAFVSQDGDSGPGAVRKMCQKWLPKFMVPSDIIPMDTLPRLASGKIDRKALEQSYSSSRQFKSTNLLKYSLETERKIADCAGKILSSPVDPLESLTMLGLDSLKAIKLASSLRNMRLNLDVSHILEADSIRGIAKIAKTLPSKEDPGSISISASEPWSNVVEAANAAIRSLGCHSISYEVLPCSSMQISMIAESMRIKGPYSNWVELEFGHEISLSDVRSAFSLIAAQNEILRSGFVETNVQGHTYAQIVWQSLHEDVFIESHTFQYDLAFHTQHDLLHPFLVELQARNSRIRALVHIHHAIYDGWSWEHITADLQTHLTKSPCKQRPQYRLFVDYVSRFLESQARIDAIDYWRDNLEDVSPTVWPNFQDHSDIPRRLRSTKRRLDVDIACLDAVSRDLHVSRQTILQGALAILFGQYNGMSDVVFGSVTSGRTLPVDGIEDIIGPCINTIPIRINLEKLRTIQDLLATLHSLNRRSLVHGLLPFRDIKAASKLHPSVALFDTLFVWQDTANEHHVSPDILDEVASADALEFCLTLEFDIKNGILSAKATYQESALPESQVNILLEQLENLASIFIDKPDLNLKDINEHLPLSCLSTENVHFTSTAVLPGLSDGVRQVAALDPSRTAVEFLETFDADMGTNSIQKLSYSELLTHSDYLANRLRTLGVGPGSLVCIYLEKSLELYISILAVIDTGAGYVPLTPQTPVQRVHAIMSEASCYVCITTSHLLANLKSLNDIIALDSDGMALNSFTPSKLIPQNEGQPIAYVIFTSGSTGVPKGVLVSHDNMRDNIAVLSEIYPTSNGSKLLQACSHAFDVSVFEIFFTWAMGMTLCSATNDVLFRDIEQVIRIFDVTHLSLTPTVASLIKPQNVPQVQFLVTAGEALTAGVAQEWAGVGIYQGYGPCETTNICTIKPRVSKVDFLSNVGKPFKNTSAFVISDKPSSFSLVPKGAIGEFCFGGTQVALGYLNMPNLTKEKFIEHAEYGRLYRSGDYGRMLPDGSLAFAGRRDDLIKLRGQRIELGEINTAILRQPLVKSCTTFVYKSSGNQLLVSYWIPTPENSDCVLKGSENSASFSREIFDSISQILPKYMIPSFILPIQRIPMTVNGKVNTNALVDRFSQLAPEYLDLFGNNSEISDNTEEFSEAESQIVQLVASVTNTSPSLIGRHSSFYRLGMDSISAIPFSRLLKSAGYGQVDVSVIMKNDTVSRLVTAISSKVSTNIIRQHDLPSLGKLFSEKFIEQVKSSVEQGKEIRKILPCTPLQEAMLSKFSSVDSTSYFNHLTFDILANVSRLKSAWKVMVSRHDILRTYFLPTDNARFAFAQIVLDTAELPWTRLKCSDADSDNTKESLAYSAIYPDRTRLPYIFKEFYNATTSETQLHLFIHHALYDGEAMARLLQEVEDVMLGKELPPPVAFDSYLEQMIQTDTQAADYFWGDYLDGFFPTYIASPKPRAWNPTQRKFHTFSSQLDHPLSSVINSCKDANVTLLSLLQAAWAKLLAFYSCASDVCFGHVTSCRSLPVNGAERIVGPCFNTLPMRVKLDKSTINSDLTLQLRKSKVQVLPYQLTSLRQIQQRFAPNGSRLFDTLLLLQKSPRPLDEAIWRLVNENGDMDFPFVCEVVPDTGKDLLEIKIHCDGSHVPLEDLDQMLQDYTDSILHTLKYPSARAVDTSMLRSIPRSFICISKPDAEKESTLDNTNIWTAEALEVRELVSSLSNINTTSIGLETTIYRLGLDSINAIQIASTLKTRGYEISAGDILEAPSIAEIAFRLRRPSSNAINLDQSPLSFKSFECRHWDVICHTLGDLADEIEYVRPCTTVQAGMLALFINSEGDLYFNHMCLESTHPMDEGLLKTAWKTTVERNEMLRTGFCHVNDEHSPFAMITYRCGTFKLPWNDLPCEDLDDMSEQAPVPKSSDYLNQLFRPAWYLTVKTLSDRTILRFSALHALYDAHSLNIILSEVSQLYNGAKLPRPPAISPILEKILYRSSTEEKETENIWEDMCKDMPVTKFPDLNPIRTDKLEVRVLSQPCSKPLSSIVQACSQKEITLQAASQVAWARLLASYLGEYDITYGIVLSGRTISTDAHDIVFPCLTTVPSCYKIWGSNMELVQRTMQMNALLIKGQYVPLAKIQRMANAETTVFDTLFVYQKFMSTADRKQSWNIVEEDAVTDYPISIEIVPTLDKLQFCVTFKSNILPVGQAQLLLDQLDWLLVNTIFSPDSDCTQFQQADRGLLSVVPRKDTLIEAPVRLLHQFVELNANNHPSRTALEFAYQHSHDKLAVKSWSYTEFNDQGNRFANLLMQLGARKSKLIGICFDKCPEAYFSILAIMKIGSAYVALDPGAPIARKEFIIKDSGSNFLLCTSKDKKDLMRIGGIEVIAIDEPSLLDGFSSEPPILEDPIFGDDTCYCLYTSGSTGVPKGCEITHNNAIQAMLAFQRLFAGHWDQTSRWLQFASFHFDVSVLEQYWSWSAGICLTACPRDILFEDLPGAIRQLRITHIDLTPSLARLLRPEDVPSLCRGVFITGGEALNQEILDTWGEKQVIYNGYGPTEVTIGCTMLPRVTQFDKPSNIGPQFDNVSSYVFIPGTDIPVLRGGVGELCVSGPLVGRGYLNNPELTDKRFQYMDAWGEKVYRTGDLVRLLHDNSFCFLGRIDDQVKLRGQRLEIDEINHVIKSGAAFEGEVATMVLKHPSAGKEQLVSFITRQKLYKNEAAVSIDSASDTLEILRNIQRACHLALPGYMIPTHIIPLTRFPLSPNNKTERKSLKQIYSNLTSSEMQSLSPNKNETQPTLPPDTQKIMSVISQVARCNVSDIALLSNVFQLGIDSISAISLAQHLREAGFSGARPALIMKHPVVSVLSEELCKSDHVKQHQQLYRAAKQIVSAFAHKHLNTLSTELHINPSTIEAIVPSTPLQDGMIYSFLENQGMYLSNFTFELELNVDIWHLEESWRKTQRTTQILRTKFLETVDGHAQVVLKDDAFPWFNIETSDTDILTVSKTRYTEWRSAFHSFTGKIWEAGVIRGPLKTVMCLNMFHGLYDGISLPLLLETVAQAYFDIERQQTPSYIDILPFGPLAKNPGARHFWTENLKTIEEHKLIATDEQLNDKVHNATVEMVTGNLEEVRRNIGVTEQAIIHGCWLGALKEYFGFIPIIGLITSGRALDVDGADSVIGPLFNTIPSCVPARVSAPAMLSIMDLIQACHKFHISTLPFQHTPLRDIMKWVGRGVDNPLFNALFVFQKASEDATKLSKLLWSLTDSQSEADYPIAFECTDHGNDLLVATLIAKNSVLNANDTTTLVHRFKTILLRFLESPSAAMTAYPGCATMDAISAINPIEEKPRLVNSNLDNNTGHFEWSNNACQLRREISILANVDNTVDENTSILQLGLDSIDAIKLSSRLKKLGIILPVSKIMHCRTIKSMMKELSSNPTCKNKTLISLTALEKSFRACLESEGIDLSDIEYVLPATPLQESMLAEMLASDFMHYYNHDILEVEPHIDSQKLKEALVKGVEANPIFRTSFMPLSNPNLPFSFVQIVGSASFEADWMETATAEQSIDAIFEKERRHAIDSGLGGPLFRLNLLHSDSKRFVVISIAHALYDGWSLDLFHQNVARYYYSGADHEQQLYHGVLEYIVNSANSETCSQFWKGYLQGIKPAPFPRRSGGIPHEIYRAETTAEISSSTVVAFCKSQGITLQTLGLTSWLVVLAIYLCRLDVVFGTVMLGRDASDAEEIIFPTMNSVAIRGILHGTRRDMLRYVQEMLGGILENQHFPLRKAKALSATGSQDLFDTLFMLQKRPPCGDMRLYKSIESLAEVEYPVCVELEIVEDSVVWRVACKSETLSKVETTQLLEKVQYCFAELIHNPERPTVDFREHEVSVFGSSFSVADTEEPEDSHELNVNSEPETTWTIMQEQIRRVLSLLSNTPETSITRNTTLFHIGLDSISAIKVSSLLKKESIVLPVSDMLMAGTLEKMARVARFVETHSEPLDIRSICSKMLEGIYLGSLLQHYDIKEEELEFIIPATSGQAYMLEMWRNSNGLLFFPDFMFRLEGTVSQKQLEDSWNRVIHQLPILRTEFISTDNDNMTYLQAVFKYKNDQVIWRNDLKNPLNRFHSPERNSRLVTLYASRCTSETVVMLHIHHALYDAVSLQRIMDLLYMSCCGKSMVSGAMEDISHFIAFSHTNSPAEARRAFWTKYLTGASQEYKTPPSSIPRNSHWPGTLPNYHPSLVADIEDLENVARTHGVSIQSIFLAVYAKIHMKYFSHCSNSTHESLVLGLYLANRSNAMDGLLELAAPTLNIVPLHIKNPRGCATIQLAQSIQRDIHSISNVQNSCVSLNEIAKWTGVTLDVIVNFLRYPDTKISHDGNELSSFMLLEETDMTKGMPREPGTFHLEAISGGHRTQENEAESRRIFKPSIDVEAAIRHKSLDVGIFGPETRINIGLSEAIMGELKQELFDIYRTTRRKEKD
ncbi:hypothetical protein LOZ66_006309 [Ophidiomyces ophidiicola]|nr:hypothetical protein LOZ66_006309 [Ophidiomyces ophidiicola]